jgi:hypothetical protein
MKKILIVLIVLFSIISCEDIQTFDMDEFDSQIAKWKALNINIYQFTAESYDPSCLTEPVTVTVLPGMEPKLTYDQEKVNANPGYLFYISGGRPFVPFYGLTIDELIDSVRKSILGSPKGTKNKIRYNKDFYFPEYYFNSTDGKKGIGGAIDLEITYFEVLQDSGEE